MVSDRPPYYETLIILLPRDSPDPALTHLDNYRPVYTTAAEAEAGHAAVCRDLARGRWQLTPPQLATLKALRPDWMGFSDDLVATVRALSEPIRAPFSSVGALSVLLRRIRHRL